MQRLQILWHMAYYGIPRKRVQEHFCIAKSTLYRWLHTAEQGMVGEHEVRRESPRKTPAQLAELIWDIFESNPHFGRHRIAMTLWTLRVFVAASTVRNLLLRPRPAKAAQAATVHKQEHKPRQIVARYPNHVWSVDRTRVWRWRIWPSWVLVGVDHYSRMVTTTCPLEGPNAGWVTTALESAFAELLRRWDISQRFGAVGQHGAIAVTERVIWTLKHEWLNRVAVIRGVDHLSGLLDDFGVYYNGYRGHMTLGGAPPVALYRGAKWRKPQRSAKVLPGNIERRLSPDVRVTAYRLAA